MASRAPSRCRGRSGGSRCSTTWRWPRITARRSSRSREKAYAQAREALELVHLPADPRAGIDGLGAAGLKKLELARALATQPRLLLADESLGGLDEHEMEQAADLLAAIRARRGITIIWVEHIMGVLMRVVDRCVVLDHGEVIAAGKPQAVAHDPKVIEVYLGTDAARGAGRDRRAGALMLKLESVSAGYGSFQALFDITLEVNAGETVAVIGPNGAGKTTLLRVLSKLIDPLGGEMTMEGRPAERGARAPGHRATASPTCRRTGACSRA